METTRLTRLMWSSWFLAGTLGAAACSAERPPITYETEHFRIGVDAGYPLCEGELDRLDERARSKADFLGVSPVRDQALYIYAQSEDMYPFCRRAARGCFRHWDAEIHTTWGALDHEIGHAAKSELGAATDFLEEGTATALQDRGVSFGRSPPSSNLFHPVERVEYLSGAHFVLWLRAEFGAPILRRLLSAIDSTATPFSIRQSLESILGEPFEVIEQRYELEAPVFFPGFRAFEPQFELVGSDYEVSLPLDCEQPTTRNYRHLMTREVDFTVAEAGTWQVLASGDAVFLLHRVYPFGATPDEVAYRSVPSTVFDEIHHDGAWRSGTTVALPPGTYWIEVGVPAELGSETVTVQFLRASEFIP